MSERFALEPCFESQYYIADREHEGEGVRTEIVGILVERLVTNGCVRAGVVDSYEASIF